MKKISITIATLALSLLSAAPALATDTGSACPGGNFNMLCLTASQLGGVVGSFITLAFVLVGLVALGFLVWGGFKWLTSEGEKQAVEEARNHIVAAIVGLIVIFLSYLIVNVLLSFITGGKVNLLTGFTLPTIGNPGQ